VALLTFGFDWPYGYGLAMVLVPKGVGLEVIWSTIFIRRTALDWLAAFDLGMPDLVERHAENC
jgi:hypothetical protein